MPRLLLVLSVLAILTVACGEATTPGAASTPGAVLEVDLDGNPIAYLSSDNVDPTSLGSPDPTSHLITSLPPGLVVVCSYTLSQGVHWKVWAIAGDTDSLAFAKDYCARNGQ